MTPHKKMYYLIKSAESYSEYMTQFIRKACSKIIELYTLKQEVKK